MGHLDLEFPCVSPKLLSSEDDGASWQILNDSFPSTPKILEIVEDGVLLAGTYLDGIFKSIDGGSSWSQANIGLPGDRGVGAIAVQDSQVVYAAISDQHGGGSIYKSTDAGESWRESSSGINTPLLFTAMAAMPDGNVLAGTTQTVFKSTDGGNNWGAFCDGLPAGGGVQALAIGADNYIYAAVHGEGVYRVKKNGDSWSSFNEGLGSFDVFSLAAGRGEIYAGTDDCIFMESLQPDVININPTIPILLLH
jgi:photosystem II stability/assembly factor-like uncharacterized protein